MTLYRLLLIWSFIILSIFSTGLWIFEFKQTKNFLENQLQSHAQDAATSLGLSITSVGGGQDVAIMQTMTNAMFDRGFYKKIRINDIDDKVLVDRVSEVLVEKVPNWFVQLIPLSLPGSTSLIMDGWQQAGTIYIESNPGYAYKMLWQSAKSDFIWFSCTFAFVALIGSFTLKKILSPLKAIEKQAAYLTERKFLVQEKLPKTRELKLVTQAMNRTTLRLQEIFNEQTELADSLLAKLYQDPLTQVGNRRYVTEQIKSLVETSREDVFGSFLIIQILRLQQLNQQIGYQKSDAFIVGLSTIAQSACSQIPGSILGRLGGTDFAMLLPNTEFSVSEDFANKLVAQMNEYAAGVAPNFDMNIICGGAYYQKATNFTRLASRADAVIEQLASQKAFKAVIIDVDDQDHTFVPGKTETKNTLEQIIDSRNLHFYIQPIFEFNEEKKPLHYEVLTRFTDGENRTLSVGTLIPTAERDGLMPLFDRIILEEFYNQITSQFHNYAFSVNLSPLSVSDKEFMQWFITYLDKIKAKNIVLNFEFPEYHAVRFEDAIKEFSDTVNKSEHALGIDHFGQGLTNLRYINSILPSYVKIDRSITNSLKKMGDESYFLISTLCNVAHSLDIRAVVEGIESEGQIEILRKINIDAVQGFYYQKPERLSPHLNNIVNQ